MALFSDANPTSKQEPKVWFKELSLTGNMALDEMRATKITWKTVDDHKLKSKMDFEVKEGMVTLEPQRIRVFEIKYEPTFEDFGFIQ